MKSKIIATPFYYSDSCDFVNTKNKSFDSYHDCIYQLFKRASFYNVTLILFVNKMPPPDFEKKLIDINVKIIVLSSCIFTENTNLKNNFPGCLFLLDAIQYAHDNNLGDILFLDSDIYINECLNLDMIYSDKISFYTIDYDRDRKVNGRSINEMAIDRELHLGLTNCDLHYCGGEYVYIPRSKLKIFSEISQSWYVYYNDKKASITEEHILSQVMSSLNESSSSITSDDILKRIWNTFRYNNICGDEFKYMLLHIPAEKDKGFRIVSRRLFFDKTTSLCIFNLYKNRLLYLLKRVSQIVNVRCK